MSYKLRDNIILVSLIALVVGLIFFVDIKSDHSLLVYVWALRISIVATISFIFSTIIRQKGRLLRIIEETDDIILWSTLDKKIKYINKSGMDFWDLEYGKPFPPTVSSFHPVWAADIIEQEGIPYAIANGIWRGNTAIANKHGREVPTSQVIIFHPRGSPYGGFISTIIRDASREKEERERLQERSRDLQAVIDNGIIGFAVVDERNSVVYINDAGAKILQGKKNELQGVDFGYHLDESAAPTIIQICDNDGGLHDAELVSTKIEWSGERMHLAMFRDISQVKKIEELNRDLQEARKRETAAVIAGGIAHDLNNILTAILGLPDLVAKRVKDHKAIEMLDHIKGAAERAASIVTDMMLISRPPVYPMESMRLRALIQGYLNSPEYHKLSSKFPGVNVSTVNSGGKELGINGSYINLFKVLMNLVKNAFESIHGEGEVNIDSGPIELRQPTECLFSTIQPGSYVFLRVKDTGIGISKQNIKKVFDAFFTCNKAKKSEHNSGLGLTIVRTVLERHDAGIVIESKEGEGTTFTIYFKAVEYKTKPDDSPPEDLSGSGVIMVLDDMDEQLFVARAILQDLGYTVETAKTPEEMEEKSKGVKFDVVLIDARLNGHGSGVVAWTNFRKTFPQQRGFLITGNNSPGLEEEAERKGLSGVLQKPLTRELLGRSIRNLLRETA